MIKVPDFEAEHYGIALRQDDTELRDTLTKALATIKASEYDRIHQQYLHRQISRLCHLRPNRLQTICRQFFLCGERLFPLFLFRSL